MKKEDAFTEIRVTLEHFSDFIYFMCDPCEKQFDSIEVAGDCHRFALMFGDERAVMHHLRDSATLHAAQGWDNSLIIKEFI